MTTHYRFRAIFEPFEENGVKGYNVTVPALPGCLTWGSSLQEAKERIVEAIELYLEYLAGEGLPVPPDESVDEVIEVAITA